MFYWLLMNISHIACSDEIYPHNWLCWPEVTGCMDILVANQIHGWKGRFQLVNQSKLPKLVILIG